MRRALLLAALCAFSAPAATARAEDVLPDLDQAVPSDLQVVPEGNEWHLGFDSAVDNVGEGPLVVDARRSSTRESRMRADQLVLRDDGSMRRRPGIGSLRFVVSFDHNHWHYLGFDRYELRRVSDYRLVAPDGKTGFCLGDRYETDTSAALPTEPQEPQFTSRCGLGQRDLLTMREGISPGFGDDYGANLEGQFVDVTRVPAGRYFVVHRVNADKKLLESRYSNNAASVLVSLTWPRGTKAAPRVKVLRRCPDTERCDAP